MEILIDEHNAATEGALPCQILWIKPNEGTKIEEVSLGDDDLKHVAVAATLSSKPLIFIGVGQALSPEFMTIAVGMLSKSKTIKLVLHRGDSLQLCIYRETLAAFGGFPAMTVMHEAFSQLLKKVLLERSCAVFEVRNLAPLQKSINDRAASNNKTQKDLPTKESLSFKAGTSNFEFRGTGETKIVEVEVSLSDDKVCLPLIQKAVESLNQNNNAEAAQLFKRITFVRRDIADLFFLQAIAEARCGLPQDAVRSLMALLERVPAHEAGRQMYNELRNALRLG